MLCTGNLVLPGNTEVVSDDEVSAGGKVALSFAMVAGEAQETAKNKGMKASVRTDRDCRVDPMRSVSGSG
jgi:hypothetical protein